MPLLAFTRGDGEETVLCAFNAGDEPASFSAQLPGTPEALLGWVHLEQEEADGPMAVTVPPRSGAALLLPGDATAD